MHASPHRFPAISHTLLRVAAVCATAALLAGCTTEASKIPDVSTTSAESSATASPTKSRSKAEAESTALGIIKDASTYEESMNARVVTDPSERLDSTRSPGLSVVVRIDRDGRAVDLMFMRYVGGFSTVVFGPKGATPTRGYDHKSLDDGNAVLALVDKLAEGPSQGQ